MGYSQIAKVNGDFNKNSENLTNKQSMMLGMGFIFSSAAIQARNTFTWREVKDVLLLVQPVE